MVTVHFLVFVLSWSRLMVVVPSRRTFDTERFIQAHDEAFRAFGGVPEECVYDQTKFVVVQKRYRELTVNERFAHYATAAQFRIRAREGYNPQSKSKVEAGVKYVKGDGLYGESFADWAALEAHLPHWCTEVANQPVHGSTGEVPLVRFEREASALRPYLRPASSTLNGYRAHPPKVDKTSLISFQGNKYSVPIAFQSGRVNVLATGDDHLKDVPPP